MRSGITLVVVFSTASLLVAAHAFGAEERFSGLPVAGLLGETPATISCFADKAATVGYYTDDSSTVLKSEPLKSQAAGGGYRISINDGDAVVLDESMKRTDAFQVYQRTRYGVILVRGKGVGIEVITIDPRTGAFVLTDAGVGPLWNRASVWVGRCRG